MTPPSFHKALPPLPTVAFLLFPSPKKQPGKPGLEEKQRWRHLAFTKAKDHSLPAPAS